MLGEAGYGPEGPGGRGTRRGLVFAGLLAVVLGVAVAASALDGSSPNSPSKAPGAGQTAAAPRPTNSAIPSVNLPETALPLIGGLALEGKPITSALTRSDPGAVDGAWTVVVRRADGSLGLHGAVVTYPASMTDHTGATAPIRVGSATGISGRGFILWPLGNGHAQARVRGDLPQADLARIAGATMIVAGRPQVTPPQSFHVIAVAPYRLPLIHEIRYGTPRLGLPALGDGITYCAMTSGGGFEDALYATGSAGAGTVHGAAARLSSVQGGNATVAWEPSPGVVAYVGWSGAATTAKAVTALRALAAGTHILTPRQWLATKPEVNEQENNPAGS